MNAPLPELTPLAQLPWQQRLLRSTMRGGLSLLFRGVIRPPLPVAWQRAWLRVLTLSSVVPKDVTISAVSLNGVPCERLAVQDKPIHAVLYVHGGAFCIGSPQTHRSITANLAKRSGAVVYAVDYRLTPEHAFPAGLDDVHNAYRGLLAAGFAPQNIAIAGDSAGGNLTLACVLRLLETGEPLPAALLPLSPLTDASRSQLHEPPAGDPLLNPQWVKQASAQYCAAEQLTDPLVSPVYAMAEQLKHFPPSLIQVGEDEILLNDSLRMHQALEAAGAAVSLERYPGYWHVFQAQVGLLQAADVALVRMVAFLRRHWRDA
ncbi:Acetyl esterase/lipase [Atopomonas hussainii]|uniref:Acetyl esterase/lipase n=1 Tax=Atopomonas hussainii TaxID=1429083 RepID=A0A1H7H494_9GAMM|nr:alpha/beta hydrolase [Atopomonas hussainii]SEK45119.1 Acetyl esterase/lipase [Atopomonas hussainii]